MFLPLEVRILDAFKKYSMQIFFNIKVTDTVTAGVLIIIEKIMIINI